MGMQTLHQRCRSPSPSTSSRSTCRRGPGRRGCPQCAACLRNGHAAGEVLCKIPEPMLLVIGPVCPPLGGQHRHAPLLVCHACFLDFSSQVHMADLLLVSSETESRSTIVDVAHGEEINATEDLMTPDASSTDDCMVRITSSDLVLVSTRSETLSSIVDLADEEKMHTAEPDASTEDEQMVPADLERFAHVDDTQKTFDNVNEDLMTPDASTEDVRMEQKVDADLEGFTPVGDTQATFDKLNDDEKTESTENGLASDASIGSNTLGKRVTSCVYEDSPRSETQEATDAVSQYQKLESHNNIQSSGESTITQSLIPPNESVDTEDDSLLYSGIDDLINLSPEVLDMLDEVLSQGPGLTRSSRHSKPKKLHVNTLNAQDYSCDMIDEEIIKSISGSRDERVVVRIDDAWVNYRNFKCLLKPQAYLNGDVQWIIWISYPGDFIWEESLCTMERL